MYIHYQTENIISNIYKNFNILHPSNIKIQTLSEIYNIKILYNNEPSYFYSLYGINIISIDSRLPFYEQKESFLHEFGHYLLHTGNHTCVHELMLSKQEAEANNFVLYAAMPYFMLSSYNFEKENIIEELSVDFAVSHELVIKRLEKIYNQRLLLSSNV